MSFLGIPCIQYDVDDLNRIGHSCYNEGRKTWIRAPHVAPVPLSHLAGAAGC